MFIRSVYVTMTISRKLCSVAYTEVEFDNFSIDIVIGNTIDV